MKVTSVELRPDNTSLIPAVFSYKDLNHRNPYNVKAILGLDPGDIINETFLGLNNSQLNDLSLLKREIVIVVELNPFFADGEDFSDLRDALYRMIWTTRSGLVHLDFKNGSNVVALTSGLVIHVESAQFSKTPAVQITIKCDEPMLRGPDDINVPLDDFDHSRITVYDPLSTAPHGFNFMVTFTEAASRFKMGVVGEELRDFVVTPIGGFLNGDVLICSTDFNKRALTVTRGSVTTHLMDAVSSEAVWPILFPGRINIFELEHPEKFTWNLFSHIPAFWGV
jgi:hypothetical protein